MLAAGMARFCLLIFIARTGDVIAGSDEALSPTNTDKTGYTLFNSTPPSVMREMSTDRPDTTESPYTVDAGHLQAEISLFDYARHFDGGLKTTEWSFGQMNFKVGLFNHTDLQLMFNSYTTARWSGSGLNGRSSGFSDVTVRVKTNLWGNDGGKTALAVMPFVTIPTQAEMGSDRWSGGLVIPFAVEISDRLSLGAMIQPELVPNAETSGYNIALLHSASLGISLTKELGSYFELVGIAESGDDPYQALFNYGLTFNVTDNLMLDAGVRIGLNSNTPDFGAFTGVSVRF